MSRFLAVFGILVVVAAAGVGWAAEAPSSGGGTDEDLLPARRDLVPMPTLGGHSSWGDELFFHEWRIQRKVGSAQCRLLDGNNLRHASGTFAACVAALDQIKRERDLPAMKGKGVIVLHGIADSRGMMTPLCRHLEEKGGYTVFNVSYPSTRQGIAEHAKGLASVVDHLDGIDEINFVGYSLGNIVIRRYFADHLKRKGGKADARFKRMVMIGPPNRGSELATSLGENKLFELLLGKAGQQLGPLWAWEVGGLATPPMEFGIVAGGCGDGRGFNPLLPGDDDGVVSLVSTHLAGAADFIVVPSLHNLLPRDYKVHEYTLRFLQHGWFVTPEQRKPLADEERGEKGEGRGERREEKKDER